MANEQNSAKAYTDRNVYILGAGFSVDAGLPVMRDFMNSMRDSVSWLEHKSRTKEAEAIGRVLAFRKRAASAAYNVDLNVENVEDLFSLASAREESLTQDVTLAIAATLDFAESKQQPRDSRQFQVNDPSKFDLKHLGWKDYGTGSFSCPLYDYYLGAMIGFFSESQEERHNTIVTLNYDLLPERSFERLGAKYCYGFDEDEVMFEDTVTCQRSPEEQSILLLKLHGSVNWAATTKRADNPVIKRDYHELLRSSAFPLLAPPTWRKVYSGVLSTTWERAVTALSTATHVIILGYSIPSTDQQFKYLVAAGLQENISLRKIYFVNPMPLPNSQERLSLLFRRELLERGTVEVVPSQIATFLESSEWLERINRRFGGNCWLR